MQAIIIFFVTGWRKQNKEGIKYGEISSQLKVLRYVCLLNNFMQRMGSIIFWIGFYQLRKPVVIST